MHSWCTKASWKGLAYHSCKTLTKNEGCICTHVWTPKFRGYLQLVLRVCQVNPTPAHASILRLLSFLFHFSNLQQGWRLKRCCLYLPPQVISPEMFDYFKAFIFGALWSVDETGRYGAESNMVISNKVINPDGFSRSCVAHLFKLVQLVLIVRPSQDSVGWWDVSWPSCKRVQRR